MQKPYKPRWDADRVSEKASGRWLEIFQYLAGNELQDALRRVGRHVRCPSPNHPHKKGKGDGFRLLSKHVVFSGASICNTCGTFGNGFRTLMFVKGWSFPETLEKVALYLGVEPENPLPVPPPTPAKSISPASVAKVTDERDAQAKDDGEAYRFRFVRKDDPRLGTYSPKPAVVSNTPAEVITAPVQQFITAPNGVAIDIAPGQDHMAEVKALQAKFAARMVEDSEKSRARIHEIWSTAEPLRKGIPVPMQLYLQSRGILLSQSLFNREDCVRFHPELELWDEVDDKPVLVGKFPGFVLAVETNEGELITLQRHFLTKKGKKAPGKSKKMLPIPADKQVLGAAVHLGGQPVNGVLGVAEGFETAASALRVYQIPTWPCVSATLLEAFEPPKGVHTLIVWADKDVSTRGTMAAHTLVQRLSHKVRVIPFFPTLPIPKNEKTVDWNDVLVQQGVSGFPSWNLIKALSQKQRAS